MRRYSRGTFPAARAYSTRRERNEFHLHKRGLHEEATAAHHTDCWIEPRADLVGGRADVRRTRHGRPGDRAGHWDNAPRGNGQPFIVRWHGRRITSDRQYSQQSHRRGRLSLSPPEGRLTPGEGGPPPPSTHPA